MSAFDLSYDDFNLNPKEREKCRQIWYNTIKEFTTNEIDAKKELAKCAEYGLDIFDEAKKAAIKFCEDSLAGELDLELEELNDDGQSTEDDYSEESGPEINDEDGYYDFGCDDANYDECPDEYPDEYLM